MRCKCAPRTTADEERVALLASRNPKHLGKVRELCRECVYFEATPQQLEDIRAQFRELTGRPYDTRRLN